MSNVKGTMVICLIWLVVRNGKTGNRLCCCCFVTGKTGEENILLIYLMISRELNKKLSNFEKKDCFQNNRGHAAKCPW